MMGLRVNKKYAQTVLSRLKELGVIDPQFRIQSSGDDVIIPLSTTEFGDVLVDIPSKVEDCEFEQRSQRNSSLRYYLSTVLPKDLTPISSFDTIGEIAVVDIKEDLLPFKKTIAEGILKTSPKIRTVFRKMKAVSGEFRLRQLEYLAGEDSSSTVHKEYGVNLMVDIRKVYFSPRLSTEHWRISQMVHEGERILDLFTATGIFPLVIAKYHDCEIVAVDHNPHGIEELEGNISRNKLLGTIEGECSDAGIFHSEVPFDRIIMNHPSGSENFLTKADSLLKVGGILHFYTFVPIENFEKEAADKLHSRLPRYEVIRVHRIRQYSPNEYHVAVDARKV